MTHIIADYAYTQHLTGLLHPECPERYIVIEKALTSVGLKTPQNTLSPQKATREDILLCHTADYYTSVENDIKAARTELSTGGDVVLSPKSIDIAHLAVGGVKTAVDAVMKDNSTAFCLIRPPGHHAITSTGMGFCIFNNVAIGTRYVQKKYQIKRVLIVDWDVHHGNGTEEIFLNDPSVFFFSTQQRGIYPGTGDVDSEHSTPIDPSSDAKSAIIHAFETKLIPSMDQFKPEFVFISCGFDALQTDPLGALNLKPESFAKLTKIVKQIASKYSHGRIVSCLEGGYDLNGIGAAAVAHVRALKA